MASTQGGVGKLTAAASASAISGSDLGNRTSSIEHSYDRSRPWWKPASKGPGIAVVNQQ
jgi:hypothetical protein